MSEANPTISRLEEQIQWYDTKSQYNRRWYISLKILEIASGALITLGAGFKWSYGIIGSLGFIIILFEGIQNVGQLHHQWMSYRSTCEYLKKEKSLFFAKAGPYRDLDKPEIVLAERIEELISQEHAKWVKDRKKTHEDLRKEK